MIASMASMLDNFNTSNIELLREMGYEITLAANFKTEDSNSRERVQEFRDKMLNMGCHVKQIDFTRKIWNIKGQMKSFRQVKALTKDGFGLVHCHSPICAAITRFHFQKERKEGLKIIYTAHGFHFYKGAPIKNWILYFSIEWICAYWTDILITINKEDYTFARKHLKVRQVEYVPGVGIDLEKFRPGRIDREKKRGSLGVKPEEVMLLSVGELNRNKNHMVVIKALERLRDTGIKYFVCGIGPLEAEYKKTIKNLGLNEQIKLLGYRNDISELCQAADLFVFPSLREGLPVALMEAMAAGKPCIASDIRGNCELIQKRRGGELVPCKNICKWEQAIREIKNSRKVQRQMGEYNLQKIRDFSLERIKWEMQRIYKI